MNTNGALPDTMHAAVYTGRQTVEVRPVPVPGIGPGELLVRVESCGVCHTDLKKIEHNLLPPPRIYGHETAGQVVAAEQSGQGLGRVDHAQVGEPVDPSAVATGGHGDATHPHRLVLTPFAHVHVGQRRSRV